MHRLGSQSKRFIHTLTVRPPVLFKSLPRSLYSTGAPSQNTPTPQQGSSALSTFWIVVSTAVGYITAVQYMNNRFLGKERQIVHLEQELARRPLAKPQGGDSKFAGVQTLDTKDSKDGKNNKKSDSKDSKNKKDDGKQKKH
eukprot:TRINITY_DN1357_c0_g1_i1.p1 TRINITY_DN1357_c0_g1~~TRINITY_DN1357_c0_g1_i1.p1  ORF type:complete len:141 (+),score=33.38 TRINITY_DN1357_c0_g1_i1:217-639(+)